MAAPAFGSAGTVLTIPNSSTADIVVPSGVAAGDIIVVALYVDGTTTVTALASGFAQATGSPLSPTNQPSRLYVMWKRATGADTGTYNFTLSASVFREGVAVRYTGAVASGDPWDDVDAAVQDRDTATTTPAVSVTTTGADRLLVYIADFWNAQSWTPPTGFTERVDTSTTAEGLLTVDDKAQASAGSSGSVSTTTAAIQFSSAAWLGALKPAAAGGSSVAPDGVPDPVALGSPSAAVQVAATPDGTGVAVALGSPTGSVQVAAVPDGVAVPVTLGSPTLAWSASIAPAGIPVPVSPGNPMVGAAGLVPAGVAVPVTLGSPTFAWSGSIAPDGIAVPVALGSPAVGVAPVAPNGASVPVTLGSPALAWSSVVAPAGIAVPVALGNPGTTIPGAVVHRPNTGTITRPDTGIVTRPDTGVVSRP